MQTSAQGNQNRSRARGEQSRRVAGRRPRVSGSEQGYALLMVVFLAATLIITTAAVAPNLLTQGLREKEEEMIWRGEQYARAVRLFYRKNGRFPQSLEELTEKKTQIRYLRQAYKDPMNREDGSWRLIYVGPAGQLIGSVTRTSALQLPTAQPNPAPTSTTPGAQQRPQPGPTPAPQPAPLPTAPGTSGPVFGGNIIGVGGKVERASIKAYNGKTTYREWEFIWDPTKDAAVVSVPGAPGQPARPSAPPRQP